MVKRIVFGFFFALLVICAGGFNVKAVDTYAYSYDDGIKEAQFYVMTESIKQYTPNDISVNVKIVLNFKNGNQKVNISTFKYNFKKGEWFVMEYDQYGRAYRGGDIKSMSEREKNVFNIVKKYI